MSRPATVRRLVSVADPALGVQFEGAEIFEPVEPPAYLLRALDLCPGPPLLFAGAAFAGKTPLVQALALSIVSGRQAWGRFSVTRGAVAHLDYEQGVRLTKERYGRLARAMGLGPEDVEGLAVRCHPPGRIDSPSAEEAMKGAAEGRQLLIVDSFRAAAPGTDENSSLARGPLDMLARVSEVTGCSFVVLHHARKPQRDSIGGPTNSLRGSSALVDAAGSVVVATSVRPGLVKLLHCKARTSGVPHAPFEVRIADLEQEDDPRWGLRVEVVEGLDVDLDQGPDQLVLAFVETNAGASKRAIRSGVEGRNADVDAAIERLVQGGALVRNEGKRGSHSYSVPGVPPCPTVPHCARAR
jgi:hypothetical protein